MSHSFARLYVHFFAFVVSLGVAGTASAYNVPGSAKAYVPHTTEIATGIIVQSLKENMRPMRDSSGSVQISTSGAQTMGLAATLGGTTPLSFGIKVRDIETPEVNGRVSVGTLLIGHNSDSGLLYFGGLVAESGDVRTRLDRGHIKHSGMGIVLGLDHRVSERLFLTAIAGAMKLDYDVTRDGGAVTGSFDAERQFVDLSADYLTQIANSDLRLSAGLMYFRQSHDGYTESGGAAVTPFSFDQLSATFDARNTWGTPGEIRPYVEMAARGRLAGGRTAAGIFTTNQSDWEARIGIGIVRSVGTSHFDAGLGMNFDKDAMSGIDAKLNYTLRF